MSLAEDDHGHTWMAKGLLTEAAMGYGVRVSASMWEPSDGALPAYDVWLRGHAIGRCLPAREVMAFVRGVGHGLFDAQEPEEE
jgi:hypothetical protein